LEKTLRQNEDFRRQNSQLISRINELEKRSGNAGFRVDEMKAKMDQAASLIQERRQEIENLKKALNDRDIVEIRLKRKIADLESKLQISKASAAGGSAGGGSGGKAA
jgi:predicted RNase H-like nuclease (RuvC/YqgF family)